MAKLRGSTEAVRGKSSGVEDLRDALAARYRLLADHYYGVLEIAGDPGGWLRDADALDRGEPLEVHGWQLPVPPSTVGFDANDRVRIEPSGSLTLVRKARGRRS
jgi:hypothetical protein